MGVDPILTFNLRFDELVSNWPFRAADRDA